MTEVSAIPAFKYICPACGLLFDKILSERKETVPCKRCPKEAHLKLTVSSTMFAHIPNAPVPQNTGASAVDHDVDLIVARSAKANLREMLARQDYKRRLMHQHDVSGHRIARVPTGDVDAKGHAVDDYWVMSEAEKRATDQARQLGEAAARQIHAEAMRRNPPKSRADVGTIEFLSAPTPVQKQR